MSPPSLTTTQASLSKAGRNMNWGKKNDFTNIHTNLYPSDSSTRGQLRVYERRHIKEQTLFLFASLFQISAWISKLWQAGSKFSLKKQQNSLRWSSFLLEPRRIWQMMKKGWQRNGINCATSWLRIFCCSGDQYCSLACPWFLVNQYFTSTHMKCPRYLDDQCFSLHKCPKS